jgi:glycosyltransferase involved in cell wall biosynthesis
MIITANYVNGQKKLPGWAVAQGDSLAKYNESLSIQSFHLLSRKSIKGLVRAGKAIRKSALDGQVDLIHAQWGTSAGLLTVLFAPVPTIVSFCGSDLLGNYNPSGKKKLSGRISGLLSQLAAIGAKKCIAKSEKLKQSIWGISESKCEVIPNGVDVELFKPLDQVECRQKLDWDPDKRYVLFFHDNTRQGAWVKNPQLAERVIEEANKEQEGHVLWKVKNYAQDFLPVLYNAADALLITSLHEGSNNSIKEAMACNLPIVTVPCGDAPERLERVAPSFIGDYDEKQLANGLVTITAAGRRSNGREEVFRQGIDSKQIARSIFDLYIKALE